MTLQNDQGKSDQRSKSVVTINGNPSHQHCLVFDERHELDRRHIWATIRAWMEADTFKHTRDHKKRRYHWSSFSNLVRIFGVGLKVW